MCLHACSFGPESYVPKTSHVFGAESNGNRGLSAHLWGHKVYYVPKPVRIFSFGRRIHPDRVAVVLRSTPLGSSEVCHEYRGSA